MNLKPAPVLAAENLRKTFDGAVVIEGVSFSVAAGELLFLLGPARCGKTTLLRMLAGALAPDAGRVLLAGADIATLAPIARDIAFAPARDSLWPQLTLRENIEFQLRQHDAGTLNDAGNAAGESPQEHAERLRAAAQELLSRHGLDAVANRRPHELAASERRRTALARALATAPRALVLDEPFDGLDDASRRAAWQRVRAIAGGRKLAVVVATSHVADALAFADRVGVLGAGVVQQLAAPVELYRRPRTRLCGEFLGNANVVTGEILFAGAGEFVAQTPLGEIRGALAEPSANPSAGAPVDILIRPEALRVDEFAPDENAFAGRVIASEFRGSTGELRFQTTAGTVLRILETNPRGALAAGGVAGTYAWVAPEDVTGILL